MADDDRRDELNEAIKTKRPVLLKRALFLKRNEADAQDLVQRTIERALLKRHLYRPGSNPTAWMVVILARLHIDDIRVAKRAEFSDRDPDTLADPSVDEIPSGIELLDPEQIRWAVDQLPPKLRDAFTLYHYERLPQKEIARRLGVRPSTIAVRIFRARAMLRQILTRNFVPPSEDQ